MDENKSVLNPMKNKAYKTCFVPLCTNTTVKNSTKLFFAVPKDVKIRKNWFKLARRLDTPTSFNYFCCEDHFDIKLDMENYIRFQLYGGARILKKRVFPHKFQCQPNRKSFSQELNRHAYMKINRKREIEEILSASASLTENINPNIQAVPSNVNDMGEINLENNDSSNSFFNNDQPRAFGEGSLVIEQIDLGKHMIARSVQVNLKKKFRSKQVMCQIVTDAPVPIKPEMKDAACSPKSSSKSSLIENSNLSSNDETINSLIKTSSESYVPKKSGSTSSFNDAATDNKSEDSIKNNSFKLTRYFIYNKPKTYIGILPDCLWILDLVKKSLKINEKKILLTLMKIRNNDSYTILGNYFGLSESQASKVFNKTVVVLAHLLKQLIIKPSSHEVKKNLSIPFRAYYSHVYLLIDAFEIQIQKPSNPVHQALTWSEYKKCNTLKYLIASTPDGCVIFISKGIGGRVSDTTLFEKCGVIDLLPPNSAVMADRGFKNIEIILHRNNCKLIRPPCVSQSKKPTKEEVIETKRIASLRIHVERVIRRVREFKMLQPHACLDLSFMKVIDDIVNIACGLINLQSPLIKA